MRSINRIFQILLLVTVVSCAQHEQASIGPIASVKTYHLGGKKVFAENSLSVAGSRANGHFIVDQISVLEIVPTKVDETKPAIIMSPGFGLKSDIYLTTVDGRDGWAHQFLDKGYKVYLINRSHTANTGFNVDIVNNVKDGLADPSTLERLIIWRDDTVWTRWGLGDHGGKEFSDGRFPVEHLDQLTAAFTAVPISEGGDLNDQMIGNPEGILELMEKVGDSVLFTHSASGLDGFAVAERDNTLLKAIVTIEPVGCPTEMPKSLMSVPVLSIFGDHLEVRKQIIIRRDECRSLAASMAENGADGTHIDLMDLGIYGNSHLMMTDKNSEELAEIIINWLEDR